MKKHYLAIGALLAAGLTASAQVKAPDFKDMDNLLGGEHFPFLYQAAAAWGDYNNDGYLDLFLSGTGESGNKVYLLKNNEGKSFENVLEGTFPALTKACATWFDYNNDGNIDIFLTGEKEGVTYSGLWKNKGGETGFEEVKVADFPQVCNRKNNGANRYVAAADYNGDGWIDLYIHGVTKAQDENAKNDAVAQLWRNVNGESFEPVETPVQKTMADPNIPLVRLSGGNAQWADVNGDGFVDLIVSGEAVDTDQYGADYGYHGSYNGLLYLNKGNGSLSFPTEFIGVEEGDAMSIDYDNNGTLDVVAAGVSWGAYDGATDGNWSWRGDLHMFDGKTFTTKNAAATGLPNNKQPVSLAVGDVNNDGLQDVLYMNGEGSDKVYLNKGDVNAAPLFQAMDLKYNDGQGAQRGGTATLADYDNDGALDAYLTGYSDAGQFARLMRNDPGEDMAVNSAPGMPTELSAKTNAGGDIAILSWKAPQDDTTPEKALKYNVYIKQGDKVRMTIPADPATGRLKVAEVSATVNKTTGYKVSGLQPGAFEWGVQAIDNGKAAGAFATARYTGDSGTDDHSIDMFVTISGENGVIRIALDDNLAGVASVYSLTGQCLHTETVNGTRAIALPAGIYMVQVKTAGGEKAVKTVVR